VADDSKRTSDKAIAVRVDKEPEDLIPRYIANRQKDVTSILSLVVNGDYEQVRILAHSMKGLGEAE